MQLFLWLLVAVAAAKTILLTNDDGYYATNIRATYYKLKEAGYNVILVAPVVQKSGNGGKFDLPENTTLQRDGEFGYVKKGAPSWDHEPDDDHIWYFNGTPASSVAFALSYLIPQKFGNISVDLTVSGPNEGTNLGPGLFSISGTIGAAYNSVYRGVPAIAFSGSNSNNSLYTDDLALNDTKSPATIYANKVVELVNTLFAALNRTKQPVLPLGYGVNVNFPPVGHETGRGSKHGGQECLDPKWVNTRITGNDTLIPDVKIEDGKPPIWSPKAYPGVEVCIFGDCSYPLEQHIVEKSDNCSTSISLFSIDYDADTVSQHAFAKVLTPITDSKDKKKDDKKSDKKDDKKGKNDKKN